MILENIGLAFGEIGNVTTLSLMLIGVAGGLIGWIIYWRNPLWCFGLFFAYLVTLPTLGSLIGGVLFVFTLMGVLGGWSARHLLQHAALALISVGGMWAIFTYGLGVFLPPGEIFSPY